MNKANSFQDLIATLDEYWKNLGCVILQPYDMEMGAGTFHPATTLMTLGKKPLKAAYVQPSRRPADGRYGLNPNRLYRFHQYQVILKPSPENIVELYLESLKTIGIDPLKHDIRLVEDDWESPTLGAWGLGWEIWCDGMEISQFTYMQQVGGVECDPITGELTYGLERIAMFLQDKENIFDLRYNSAPELSDQYSYGDLFKQYEHDLSSYCLDLADVEIMRKNFEESEIESHKLIELNLVFAAYEQCIKASNYFNILDARGVISVNERANYIARVRAMAKNCAEKYTLNLKCSD
ncbi:glycine--tRNA ligase subunit alpha [Rickettsiales endosymbiont of Stachyamoeba lipophora]|uniref:glycine--tRNA ligase subunit alpha n=1 Tax=Rickettsiales endosymbiont of Stachyamoeba lipophora TaxID=2486578 RepID=UPI000F648789|nr:glycine--tRNA ligase subunit alpha [Rickettsiales endosymbiont of Stachyamoeba lipophora]AZL16447.1 glycine--tRNA ligase subunit alpha [Rickettsiales endosymbiont of Stachyamoeba lipophora]